MGEKMNKNADMANVVWDRLRALPSERQYPHLMYLLGLLDMANSDNLPGRDDVLPALEQYIAAEPGKHFWAWVHDLDAPDDYAG